MKIKELWIENYKLLKNFDITFDEQLIVLIGQNGSGKSTLLEFVANIFYDLYEHFVLGKSTKQNCDFKLKYEIEYSGNKYETYITSNKETKEYYEINIKRNEEKSKKYSKVQINQEFDNGYKDMLPQNVVMYYSGISETLENKFKTFQYDYFIQPSLTNSAKIEQPFFYFLPENFSTILTTLLAYQYRVPEILKEQFSIDGFEKITITLKKPYWAKNTIENVWGASGDLSSFIARIINALGDESNYEITDKNIIFTIKSQEKLINIWELYGEEKSIFEYLTTLQANDLIENIEIMIYKDNEVISYDNLSEGEKQLLIILGLKELLSTENTLFLLDEPDTYLHPKWQKDFISELIDIEDSNQFIITTHSPLILSYTKNNYLRIIQDGKISKDAHYAYGRDISSIMFDLMGNIDERPSEFIDKIDKMYFYIDEENFQEAQKILDEIIISYGKDDTVVMKANTLIEMLSGD